MQSTACIRLEGVSVNNLKNVSLQFAHHQLVVICGVSGSGKSSLAFDTLFAEGQRRYVETFAPSVRQFLHRAERPAADRILGLPPVVAVQQNSGVANSRATLGQRLGIQDRLQQLFAMQATPWCPTCSVPLNTDSPQQALERALPEAADARVLITAATAFARNDAGTDPNSPDEWLRRGLTRCIADGRIQRLDQLTDASPIHIVIDRLRLEERYHSRILEAAATALTFSSSGAILFETNTGLRPGIIQIDETLWSSCEFSDLHHCPHCSLQIPDFSSALFNHSSPDGACVDCGGAGTLKPDRRDQRRPRIKSETVQCRTCRGTGLNPIAGAARWQQQTLADLLDFELGDLGEWLAAAFLTDHEPDSSGQLLIDQIFERIEFARQCGINCLSPSRRLCTLSTGEARRAELVSALSTGLTDTLYILDEPTQGLHDDEIDELLKCLKGLRDAGNTVVLVEHDLRVIMEADEVIELGPEGGAAGGSIIFQGPPEQLRTDSTPTGKALAEDYGNSTVVQSVDEPAQQRPARTLRKPTGWLQLSRVQCHNLLGVSVEIPLGVFCLVTGVSGSGKTSLICHTLHPVLKQQLSGGGGNVVSPTATGEVGGADALEHVLLMDHRAIKATPRSIPATWLGIFGDIRRLLAETHEARRRNLSPAAFSFNTSQGGRCPQCRGRGCLTVSMQFLPDIESRCETCAGTRFRSDILEVRYRDRSIAEILDMSADEAFRFFHNQFRIQTRLNTLRQSGLGYLRLNQPLRTLSGGEAQRLRIAANLTGMSRDEEDRRIPGPGARGGRSLFLLDEPTGGLHARDVQHLAECFSFLLSAGHSLVVIDHDRTLLQFADWEIRLGPGAGRNGGKILFSAPISRVPE